MPPPRARVTRPLACWATLASRHCRLASDGAGRASASECGSRGMPTGFEWRRPRPNRLSANWCRQPVGVKDLCQASAEATLWWSLAGHRMTKSKWLVSLPSSSPALSGPVGADLQWAGQSFVACGLEYRPRPGRLLVFAGLCNMGYHVRLSFAWIIESGVRSRLVTESCEFVDFIES